LRATVERVVYLGTDLQLVTRLADGTAVQVRLQNSARTEVPAPGTAIALEPEEGAARLLAD
jgi:spermidine/putrescine transport system ATP-binding protein